LRKVVALTGARVKVYEVDPPGNMGWLAAPVFVLVKSSTVLGAGADVLGAKVLSPE
jgi:hypothetical protein